MAGQHLGAHAHQSPAPVSESHPAPTAVAALTLAPSTRTRCNHGVFLVGAELARVYSSRRAADGLGVSLSIGRSSMVFTGSMTATQARAMARALTAAATAAERQGGAA